MLASLTNNPKISVIVPVYNAPKDTARLLKSLAKNFDFKTGEVILVDDCSQKETVDILEEFAAAYKATLLHNEQNLGFVKTSNRGMKAAKGDIVILQNSDTEIPPHFSERVIRCFESDPTIGIASPVTSGSGAYMILMPKGYTTEKMDKLLQKRRQPLYPLIPSAEGMCFCIRRAVIEQQGYLDEVWGRGYNEETDYSYRAIVNGWKNVLIDNLYIFHKRHASFSTTERNALLHQNKVLFQQRWEGFRAKYIADNHLRNPVEEIRRELFRSLLPSWLFSKTKKGEKRIIKLLGIKISYKKKTRGVVYTCITGSYDQLPEHDYVNPHWQYICFTDNKDLLTYKQYGHWQIRPLLFNQLDNTKNARWHKINAYHTFKTKLSIWVDSNVNIKTPYIFSLIQKQPGADLLVPLHYIRDCIYQELYACEQRQKDSPEIIRQMEQLLINEKMPLKYGLNETNLIFRRSNSPRVQQIMDEWWQCLSAYSKRDQLSFTFVLWRNHVQVKKIAIPNIRYNNKNFQVMPHVDTAFKPLSAKQKLFSVQKFRHFRQVNLFGSCFTIQDHPRKNKPRRNLFKATWKLIKAYFLFPYYIYKTYKIVEKSGLAQQHPLLTAPAKPRPARRSAVLKDENYFKRLPVACYGGEIKEWFYKTAGYQIDFDNPQTLNEKIQWLKLYDSTPLKTKLSDKYLVRGWIAEKIGSQYLIPLLGAWDSFDDIDFDQLPQQFVLKCNHGSGMNIIVKNKNDFNREEARAKISKWMAQNYAFKASLELHYRDIQPKIMAEKYMENADGELKDYKFMCLNGKPAFIWVDSMRYTDHKRNVYDTDFNLLPLRIGYENFDDTGCKPQNLGKMLELAAKLSQDFSCVRIDLYEANGKIYFGEMTFTSESGASRYVPAFYDLKFGQMLQLPAVDKIVVQPTTKGMSSAFSLSEYMPSFVGVTVDNVKRKPCFNIFLPALNDTALTAGPLGILYFARFLIRQGKNVRILIMNSSNFCPNVLQNHPELSLLLQKAEICPFGRNLTINQNDICVATIWKSAYFCRAIQQFCHSKKFIYMIQDYETIFFANSSEAALVDNTYRMDYWPMFSTNFLRQFFIEQNIGNAAATPFLVFNTGAQAFLPDKKTFNNSRNSKKQFVFYGRPHRKRNCFDLGLEIIREAVSCGILKADEWDFYSVGASEASIPITGNVTMRALPYMPAEQYRRLLYKFDLGFSLMMSPHPSMIPLDLALSGCICVTNTYKNKTAETLKNISANILADELEAEALLAQLAAGARACENLDQRYQNAIQADYPKGWEETFGSEASVFISQITAEPRLKAI